MVSRLLCSALVGSLCLASGVAAQSRLAIETEPAGATIVIDGERIGASPLEVELAPGTHRVRAWKQGFDAREQDVRVASGDASASLRLVLAPVSGRIRVEGLSPEARVLIDGVPLDESAAYPEGSVVMRVEDRGKTAMTFVEVRAESETVVSYSTRGFDPSVLSRGALLPGGAQFLGGRPGAGAAFVGGMGASALLSVGFNHLAQSADRDLAAAAEAYDQARSEREVEAARVDIDDAHARSVRHRQFRTAAFVGVLAVYVGSVLDAGLRHGEVGSLRVEGIEPTRVSLAPTASGVALRISL